MSQYNILNNWNTLPSEVKDNIINLAKGQNWKLEIEKLSEI